MSTRLPRFDTESELRTWANRNRPAPRVLLPSEYTAREEQEHFALIKWRDLAGGHMPELRYLFHVPNGELRTPGTARKLARMGVLPGVADFLWLLPRGGFHGLVLELKIVGGTLSPRQRNFLDTCHDNGYCTHVAYGWIDARHTLLNYYAGRR